MLCYTNGKVKLYRHFSLASHIHKVMHQQVFNCGQCLYCRKKRAYELAYRCVLHASLYEQNCFLTLTYDEKKDGYHNEFQYEDIQKFKKRLRQKIFRQSGKRSQVFNVHEYGRNGKKHWHLIVFNWRPSDCVLYKMSGENRLYTSEELGKIWTSGFNTVGDVQLGSAMYQAQYVQKDLKNGNCLNAKKSHSKHSGIGGPYFLRHYKQILSLGYVPFDGKKVPLPRYFQRLAHKHYCHFYEKSAFHDLRNRRALYRPFKAGMASAEVADLFLVYKSLKQSYLDELQSEWDQFMENHLTEKTTPDFINSNSNNLYDLLNKQHHERF